MTSLPVLHRQSHKEHNNKYLYFLCPFKIKHRPTKFILKWNTITRKSMHAGTLFYNILMKYFKNVLLFRGFILHCYRNKANILFWQKRFYVLNEIWTSSIECCAQAHTHKSDCVVVVDVVVVVVVFMFVFTFSKLVHHYFSTALQMEHCFLAVTLNLKCEFYI